MIDIEVVADAIDAARYQHPTHPRERPRPFSEADESDREYALRLARAVQNVAAAEWRPIETAPRDGSRILAWHQDWETSHTTQWFGTYWGVFYKTGPLLFQPTHWQPLPAPPNADAKYIHHEGK